MSKGAKRVLGVVAAIAIPFVAPAIAGAIGVSGIVGTTAVGATLGAASAALTGGDPLRGAVSGGIGGFGSAGGFSQLFGQTAAAGTRVPMPGLSSDAASIPGIRPLTPPPGIYGSYPTAQAASAAAAAQSASAAQNASVLQSMVQGLSDPATLARVTVAAASGDSSGLSSAEKALVEQRKAELQRIASTNRRLFEEQVQAAHKYMQMAEQQAPNPQQAFAQTKIATERQLAEQTRGLGSQAAAREQRRTAIRSTQTGATAAAAEEARGRQAQTQLMQAGMSALPSAVPEGYAGLALPLYRDLAERRRQHQVDQGAQARTLGLRLFGGLA